MFCLAYLTLAMAYLAGPEEQITLTVDQQLIIACHNADCESVVRALRNGANVNAVYGKENHEQLKHELDDDILMTATSWTPLLALVSHTGAYRKGDPRELDPSYCKRLAAREADAVAILLILLSHDCEVDSRTEHYGNHTALFLALRNRHQELAEVLIRWGANVNARTTGYFDGTHQLTPLHVAYWSDELTRLLLQRGSDPNALDSQQRTPRDYAMLLGTAEVMDAYTSTPAQWQPSNAGGTEK